MTIQDIERQTGLERANIRFYEREGLVTPVRQENGYRDYSQADLDLLLKIKLLRRLGLSLEAIRDLKAGAALDKALEQRLKALAGERNALDAAEQVCREMRQNSADFASLDARHYLDAYDRALRLSGSIRPKVPEGDRVEPVRCPWRRFLARGLDLTLVLSLRLCLLSLLLRINITLFSSLEVWFLGLLDWAVLLPWEAFCLSRWGTTPGKWLMGLRLEHVSGRRLTFREACWRAAEVFLWGEGGTVPFLRLYRNWKSYRAVMDTQEGPPWDRETIFVARDFRWYRAAGLGLVYAAGIGLSILCWLAASLPVHRGPLTAEEFAENYNAMARFYRLDGTAILQPNGTFLRPDMSTYIITGPQENFSLELTQEDGILTAVSFQFTSDVWHLSTSGCRTASLSAMAFGWSNARLWDCDWDLANRFLPHQGPPLAERTGDCMLYYQWDDLEAKPGWGTLSFRIERAAA